MPWQHSTEHRKSARPIAPDEPRRQSPEAKARERDMKLLESLRKLRRDRAEIAVREARDEVDEAVRRVERERETVQAKRLLYTSAQAAVSTAIDTGRQSLEDVKRLIDGVDKARDVAFHAQSMVSVLQRDQRAAEARVAEAMLAARSAAASHEKVLEWKKAESPGAAP